MKRKLAFLLLLLLLPVCLSGASAQTFFCPEAAFTMTVPDDFVQLTISEADDPDLRLLLENPEMTLSVYVSFSAAGSPDDLFQVFSGNETESGSLLIDGREASYVFWNEGASSCFLYTLTDRTNQIQFYFFSTGRQDLAREVISAIIQSVVFN